MTLFFTSDTHYNHNNILNLGDGRPFKDIEHHNMTLVNNWNNVVGVEDTVIHLGDVAMGMWPDGLKYVKMCVGRKILVPGNHDRISSIYSQTRREGFMPDYLEVFDEVWDEVSSIQLSGFRFAISHYPYNGDSHDGDRFTKIRAVDDGTPLIHGHTHCDEDNRIGWSNNGTPQFSVGVDANNWTPVSESEILEWYSTTVK